VRTSPYHIGYVEYVRCLTDHLIDETLSLDQIPAWQSDHGQVVATFRLIIPSAESSPIVPTAEPVMQVPRLPAPPSLIDTTPHTLPMESRAPLLHARSQPDVTVQRRPKSRQSDAIDAAQMLVHSASQPVLDEVSAMSFEDAEAIGHRADAIGGVQRGSDDDSSV
jgi:hypothetical protein